MCRVALFRINIPTFTEGKALTLNNGSRRNGTHRYGGEEGGEEEIILRTDDDLTQMDSIITDAWVIYNF